MLTKDTLRSMPKGIIRSLSPKVARHPETGEVITYRIVIPQDKLDLLVGNKLEDRYYVMSLLGKGGMSLVYKAKDLKTGEVVAVKCLRNQVLGDEMVVKRFKREADVLNRLNHPRIVTFYGYGTNRRGQPYFVMDYLIGTSLGEILRTQGPLELGRFQDIFVQVAAAIGHAHKHDAVHRDIKPGNIMLVERGGTADYVKIVDFGIAKVTEGTQNLTRLGEVWGSPIYMSPEQCMGSPVIDARTDIYSLGVVMYEALTGEVPFLGRNYADTMMKQIQEAPPTFKKANPNIEIPTELEQIVFRALKKKPDERYQTMMEVKRDLEKALNNSVEILKKEPSGLLNSGRHPVTDAVPSHEQEPSRTTSDRLEGPKITKSTSELQQRVTSEDMPRFGLQDRLEKPSGKSEFDDDDDDDDDDDNKWKKSNELNSPAKTSQTNEQSEPDKWAKPKKPVEMAKSPRVKAPDPVPELDFAPPEDQRLKFELTGPQVIAASTDSGKALQGRGSNGENTPKARSRTSEVANDKQKITGESKKPASIARPRKNKTSRNRLPASLTNKPEKDTTRSTKTRKTEPKDGVLKQLLIAFLLLIAVFLSYANKDYFDSLVKDFFTFPEPEHTTRSGTEEQSEK